MSNYAVALVIASTLASVASADADALALLQTGAAHWSESTLAHANTNRKPALSERGILATSTDSCASMNKNSVATWAKNDTVADAIVKTWTRFMPNSLLQRDFGPDGNCHDDFNGNLQLTSSVLTLVEEYKMKALCPNKNDEPIKREIQIDSISMEGSPLSKLGNKRNFATVLPVAFKKGVKFPVVVYLHGHKEHAVDLNWDNDLMSKFGFLRYAQRNEQCSKTLGSIVLFPQLLVNESWVGGPDVMRDFVIPMIEKTKEQYSGSIAEDQISIIGYSEGAVGALQGGLWYPDVFCYILASAPSLPGWENVSLPDKPIVAANYKDWKLRTVMATYGHWDKVGEVQDNMFHAFHMMKWFGALGAVPLHYRVYTQADHVHWESVFNRWPSLHNLLWTGDWKNGVADTLPYAADRIWQQSSGEIMRLASEREAHPYAREAKAFKVHEGDFALDDEHQPIHSEPSRDVQSSGSSGEAKKATVAPAQPPASDAPHPAPALQPAVAAAPAAPAAPVASSDAPTFPHFMPAAAPPR